MTRLSLVGALCCLMLLISGNALATPYLAAMPILEQGASDVGMSLQGNELDVCITRALSAFGYVCGQASTSGRLDLCVRLLAPVRLAPAFFALELASRRVTGLMTLFFGPVAFDLGRSWIEPSRWAWLQLVVHPRLTFVAGGTFSEGKLKPRVGWRLFPTRSAGWEVEMLFGQDGMRVSVGGVL